MTSPFDHLRAAMAVDLGRALKARERTTVAALRGALDALDNATAASGPVSGASEVPRRVPSATETLSVLRRAAATRAAAAAEFRRLARHSHAADLEREAAIIGGWARRLEDAPEGSS